MFSIEMENKDENSLLPGTWDRMARVLLPLQRTQGDEWVQSELAAGEGVGGWEEEERGILELKTKASWGKEVWRRLLGDTHGSAGACGCGSSMAGSGSSAAAKVAPWSQGAGPKTSSWPGSHPGSVKITEKKKKKPTLFSLSFFFTSEVSVDFYLMIRLAFPSLHSPGARGWQPLCAA